MNILSFLKARVERMHAFLLLILILRTSFTISSTTGTVSAHDDHENKDCWIESIYQFGDSISDVGNLVRTKVGATSHARRLPYGETYFHRATGRFSNGLLMIDFISMALHLPLLNPYLQPGASFDHGVDFAVAGATALDASFFKQRNITDPKRPPLSVQLKWFKSYLKTICTTQAECIKRMKRALFLVGEIGGNDYNYAFFQGKSMKEVQKYIPSIVGAIANAVRKVIHVGAARIVVPGNFPIGCIPSYLTFFRSNKLGAYDGLKCCSDLNKFAMLHNNYLQKALEKLRKEFPGVIILYGDYYNAFESLLHHAPQFGFDEVSLLKACCGIGGAYNYNSSRMCGSPGVPLCPNPDEHVSWDGIHLTQEAYKHMSEWLLADLLPKMQCV